MVFFSYTPRKMESGSTISYQNIYFIKNQPEGFNFAGRKILEAN